MIKDKYIWITDPHITPWTLRGFLNFILEEKPKAVFITGDITYGPTLLHDLEYLGQRVGRPLYFVLGNHDFHFSSLKETYDGVKNLCKKYKNLNWMNESGVIPINEEVALIGHDGWYDARIGNADYLKYTTDWFLIKEFKELPDMSARLEAFRKLADNSAEQLASLLEKAVGSYKTVYLLTHVPPWREANRASGTLMEKFWHPYNVNLALGQSLEKVMENHKKRNLIVLAGHTHCEVSIHAARNIECRVGRAGYFKEASYSEHIIYI